VKFRNHKQTGLASTGPLLHATRMVQRYSFHSCACSILLACVLLLGLCNSGNAAGKLDELAQRDELVCGVRSTVYPFGFINPRTNDLEGFDVDLGKAIAADLGLRARFMAVSSLERIPALLRGDIDLIVAAMTHQFDRESQIDFSLTYFMDGQRLLVRNGQGIRSISDLAGKTVGVTQGSTAEKNLSAIQPNCHIREFPNYIASFLALKKGLISAVSTDSTILLGLKAADPNPYLWDIVGAYMSDEPYGIGLPQNDSAYRDRINYALSRIWLRGEYMEIYNRWFGAGTPTYLPTDWKMEIWPGQLKNADSKGTLRP